MSWLKITSHLIPLVLQAGLHNLIWTHPEYLQKPLVRWIRLSLLPITLSLLFSDLASLKYHLPTIKFKVDIALLFSLHATKSILLAFTEPPVPSPKSKDSPGTPSFFQSIGTVISLAFLNGSCDPSQQVKLIQGVHHNIRSDMHFVFETLQRLLSLHLFGVAALICLRSAHDENRFNHQLIAYLIESNRPAIKAYCWGIFSWTNLDLYGCLLRLLVFVLKSINRLVSKMIPYQPISTKLDHLNRVDLHQSVPFPFKKKPVEASSLTDFWGKHWHGVYKSAFVEAGSVPTTHFLVQTVGLKPTSKIVRFSGIMGAFAVSAVVHEVAIGIAGPFDPQLRTTVFFLSQGVGVCLENGFKKLSNRNVGGLLGRIWMFSWLIYFGGPMLFFWLKNVAFDENVLMAKVDKLSFPELILTPFIVLRLMIPS
ncbi:hypothetical protein KEM48_000387 [Puccinia striiformis f. sp. tritici PST-130]|nr:hypothetical protein Pst134EB_001652 [Puccinia striiformis f. sp. tritici]KAI9603627.1 hypothetical protein KEM48_000387 [Puccinia striiformis f. sp. tritici PST-130]